MLCGWYLLALFGVSLDGRWSSFVTGFTEIGVFSSGFSEIASLFCLLFRYLEWCSAWIFLNCFEILRLLYEENLQFLYHWRHLYLLSCRCCKTFTFIWYAMGNYVWIWWKFFYSCTEKLCHNVLIIAAVTSWLFRFYFLIVVWEN